MASQNMDLSAMQLDHNPLGHSMEQPRHSDNEQEESFENQKTKKTEIKPMAGDNSVELEDTEGNTRGTIQNEVDAVN